MKSMMMAIGEVVVFSIIFIFICVAFREIMYGFAG